MKSVRRNLAASVALMIGSGLLAGCSAGASSGDTLTWYINPDAGGQAAVAENCSTDDYTIEVQVLPQSSTEQRIQLSRRLAAEDPEIDIMSIDPPYTAEFANAGFLAPIPHDLQTTLEQQSFKGAVESAKWDGELVVAPFWSNVQVLWYRKSFAEKAGLDMNQPVSWDQIIDAAAKNGGQGRRPGQQVRGLCRVDQRADRRRRWRDRDEHRQGSRSHARGRLARRRDRGADHREAGGLRRRAGRPVGLERGHGRWNVRRGRGRVHGQLDLHLDELRRDAARGEGRSGLHPVPAVHAGRGVPPAVRRHRRRRERVLQPRRRGDAGDRVHHLARQPGRERRAHRQHAGQRGRLRVPGAGRDLPASRCSTCSSRASTRPAPRTVTPYWSDISGAIQASWHPPDAVDSQTPPDSQQFIEDVLQGRSLL